MSNGKDQGPWGERPPEIDIDKLIRKALENFRKAFFGKDKKKKGDEGGKDKEKKGGTGFKAFAPIIAIVVIVTSIYFSMFTVGTEEVGVVLRLGKYSRTVNPGLNFVVPFVDTVYKVPVQR
ncbi:MAG: protease modulator HflK, partial [Proteobacteria bacterium]|nr:protease modulator HflK [Pseudomonadota bacterium]